MYWFLLGFFFWGGGWIWPTAKVFSIENLQYVHIQFLHSCKNIGTVYLGGFIIIATSVFFFRLYSDSISEATIKPLHIFKPKIKLKEKTMNPIINYLPFFKNTWENQLQNFQVDLRVCSYEKADDQYDSFGRNNFIESIKVHHKLK